MSRIIKIYGERNTNTNYLSKLVKLNLNATELPGIVPPALMRLQHKVPLFEHIRDLYFTVTYSRNLGWKHMVVKSEEDLAKYKKNDSNLVFLTITKNPYPWLLSLYRRPYHCKDRDSEMSFVNFLRAGWTTLRRENAPHTLNNPIELWNLKNKSYLSLNKDRTLNLTSEALLDNPDGIIQQISYRFGIEKLNEQFVNFDSSTKDQSKNTEYYRKYYLTEVWRKDLSSEAVQIINQSLDRTLMKVYGYKMLD